MVNLRVCECVRQKGPGCGVLGTPVLGRWPACSWHQPVTWTRPPLLSSCCSLPSCPYRPLEIKKKKKKKGKKIKKYKNKNKKQNPIYLQKPMNVNGRAGPAMLGSSGRTKVGALRCSFRRTPEWPPPCHPFEHSWPEGALVGPLG